jgi:hypothetical protein
MLLGLLGCASHSSLHSRNINSFSVYTLILNGSFFPFSVTPGTLTFRFVRYFSSILYGWRAPDVSSKVITNTGPASLVVGTVGMVSTEGPIATESSRDIVGGFEAAADDVFSPLVDDDRSAGVAAVLADVAPTPLDGGMFPTFVSFTADAASGCIEVEVVVVGKVESIGEE